MKVRMKQAILGAVDGHNSPAAGDVLEVSDPAGALLCSKGFAEPVAEKASDKAEKAVAPEPETRTAKKAGRPKLPRDAEGNVIREK
jgi:hypothetical protein